ncbi:MAG: DUF1566 domain-containing protein [Proteobacteria bacterium]|nr:DUF1566 domain-containing protein [Pseudomonadota bacterium]
MKYLNTLKVVMLTSVLSCTTVGYAQNKVVIIPFYDTQVIFTGIGTTGDTKCSEYKVSPGNWQEIANCASVPASLKGQDGELREGAEAEAPRYFNNDDGTVTDRLTSLIWLRDAFCAGIEFGNSWEEALGFVAELNSLGTMNTKDCGDVSGQTGTHQTDWRLPNVKELQSLLYYEHDMKADPAYPFISDANGVGKYSEGFPFQKVQIDEAYWSSTNYGFQFDTDLNVNLIDDALAVNFGDAVTDGKGKNGQQHVWAVRGGN